MKQLFVTLFALGVAVGVGGCTDEVAPPVTPADAPATAPAAGDPAPVTEGDVTVGSVRGMQILVKRVRGAEFVALNLFVRGGTRNWTKDDAGIEQLAFKVATSGGTRSLDKDAYSNKLASLGASIDGGAMDDYSAIAAKGPAASYGELFPIFAETFVAPALPASEFEIAKTREVSARQHELEDGEGRAGILSRRMIFEGHPYANRSNGSIESLGKLTADKLAPHWTKIKDTQRLVLVVVGDVDPAEVVERTRGAFAGVPRGAYVETKLPQLHYEKAKLAGDAFKLPTNYVRAHLAGPAWTNPDFVAMWVAMSLLDNRVFDEVRTKRNLSYAPGAFLRTELASPVAGLVVSAVDPNAAMTVIFAEAKRLQNEPVPAKELEAAKSVFLSGYVQGHEKVDGQANEIGQAILLAGDWHFANTFTAAVQRVGPADVQRVAKKWLVNPQTAIVGEPQKLDPKVVGAP